MIVHTSRDNLLVRTIKARVPLPRALQDIILEFANFINIGYHNCFLWEFKRFANIIPDMVIHGFREGKSEAIRAAAKACKSSGQPANTVGLYRTENDGIFRCGLILAGVGSALDPSYMSCLHPSRITIGDIYYRVNPWWMYWDTRLTLKLFNTEMDRICPPRTRKRGEKIDLRKRQPQKWDPTRVQ